MIVDDEDVLLEMIATLVEDLGYKEVVATSATEALEWLEKALEPPAVIISDVMMPLMNGVEFAQILKNNPRFENIPIILMSAADPPRGALYADGFIAKPFDLDVLTNVIESHILKQRQADK